MNSRNKPKNLGLAARLFRHCLMYSPCIAVWLTASIQSWGPNPPGLIESIGSRPAPRRIVEDHGWTSRGELWIAYRISDGVINSGVLSVPSAKQKYIQGEFDIISPETGRDGVLVVKGAVAWGIGVFFANEASKLGTCSWFDSTQWHMRRNYVLAGRKSWTKCFLICNYLIASTPDRRQNARRSPVCGSSLSTCKPPTKT